MPSTRERPTMRDRLRAVRAAAPERTIITRLGEVWEHRDTHDLDGYREEHPEAPLAAMLRVNAATHFCLRGPCVHFHAIRMPSRAQSLPNKFQTVLSTTCAKLGQDLDPLAGSEIVISCTQWWPSTLGFIPEYLRPWLRETARIWWERGLVWQGYTFTWRLAIHRWVQDHPDDRRRPFTTEDERRAFERELDERRQRAFDAGARKGGG